MAPELQLLIVNATIVLIAYLGIYPSMRKLTLRRRYTPTRLQSAPNFPLNGDSLSPLTQSVKGRLFLAVSLEIQNVCPRRSYCLITVKGQT